MSIYSTIDSVWNEGHARVVMVSCLRLFLFISLDFGFDKFFRNSTDLGWRVMVLVVALVIKRTAWHQGIQVFRVLQGLFGLCFWIDEGQPVWREGNLVISRVTR